ncbi:MAG: MATE family efflux transporter [Oscillospiraceae bacterium]
MKHENDLGKDSIKSLVWHIALPSMLAQFVSVFYSIVDRMYIGNIPKIGEVALAGVGVAGPVVTLVGAFAFLIGIGGSPLMSIKLGEGDKAGAQKIVANCFLMLCVLSVFLTGIVMLLKDKLLMWFGASATTFPYANEYFTIYLLGTVFALLATGMNQFIICQGYAKAGMRSVLLGAILNIILDPILIFALDLGVAGAAIATVLAQLGSCIYVLLFLFRGRAPIKITFGGYDFKIMRRVLAVGFTSFLIIALDNVMIIAMNAVLQKHGGMEGDMWVTCATILQSFMLIVTMPLGGITGGTQTILGFNYGARQPERVLGAQKYIFRLCLGYTAVMFLLAQIVPQLFVYIFTRDVRYVATTVWAIRVYTLGVIPLAMQYAIVDGFTGIGAVRVSLPLSFWRKSIYFVSLFLLPLFFGVRAAFFAEVISDFVGTAVSLCVYLLVMKRIVWQRAESCIEPQNVV